MHIKSITLENFRNYNREMIDFTPGLNVIMGQNAQGKTNLLEAVSYLSQGKSFRTYRDNPLIKTGSVAAYITGSIISRDRNMTVEARLFDKSIGRKQLIVNGVKLKNRGQLPGTLCTVLFTPDDIGLFKGPGSDRRKFLDDAISQLSPAYAAAVEKYEQLLKRKNKILKDMDEKPDLLENLEDYNMAMAKEGSLIIVSRARYLNKIQPVVSDIHSEMSGKREDLTINYSSLSNLDNINADREEVYIKMRQHQKSHYVAELSSRCCLSGPHKDDFELFINGMPIKTFGSQGQNRSAVVSFKLAERELLKQDIGEYPVLLLDDVLSELDGGRQKFILSKILTGQVILTCCEEENIFSTGNIIHIHGGGLSSA